MLLPSLEQRRCIPLVLSAFIAFFFCASYWLWSGGEHVRLVPSFHDADVAGAGKGGGVMTKPLPPAETATPGTGMGKELGPDQIVLAEYDEAPIREMCANSSWADSRNVVVNCESRVGGVGMPPIHPQSIRSSQLTLPPRQRAPRIPHLRPPGHRNRRLADPAQHHAPLRGADRIPKRACPQHVVPLQPGAVRRAAALRVPAHAHLQRLGGGGARRRDRARGSAVGSARGAGREVVVYSVGEVESPEGGQDYRFHYAEDHGSDVRPPSPPTLTSKHKLTPPPRPVCADPPAFVANFGRLVEFRTDTQHLASAILSALLKRFSLPPLPHHGVANNTFIGLHFRTEIDAVNVGYTSFEEQTTAYLSFVSASPIRAIYAASGNTTSLSLFGIEAAKLDPPATVVAKADLLQGKDKAALEALTWDQQALVDYLVLEKAARFAGVSDSSFSWGIAYARQVVSRQAGTCRSVGGLGVGVQFRDELSTVFGTPRDWHMDKLWP